MISINLETNESSKKYLRLLHLYGVQVGTVLRIHGIDVYTVEFVHDGNVTINFEQMLKKIHTKEYYNRVLNKAYQNTLDWGGNVFLAMEMQNTLHQVINLQQYEVFLLLVNEMPSFTDDRFVGPKGKKYKGLNLQRALEIELHNTDPEIPVTYDGEYV
jgi:hypothetical protein